MAEWKKVAHALALADGRLDTKEVEILRREIMADGRVDKSELEFLAGLRKAATSVVKVFDDLFFEAVKQHMLADGDISGVEAKWLRKNILADGKVDDTEKALLKALKSGAKTTSPEFDKLVEELTAAPAAPAKTA